MSLVSLAETIRSGAASARDTLEACLARVERDDGAIDSFQELCAEPARAAAVTVDRRVAGGEDPGPLCGVPVALKDNIATAFGHTRCGSPMLASYRSPFNATAATRLLEAGAVVVGKTRCDEFAMGSSTEHCAFGPTRNPHDPSRVPGGSSGGSAAAVAAGLVPAALGSDTGGSIRQPAALCGVVGVKPTYGRVSRYGLVAFGSSLDQIGPLAGSVADAALMLQVIAGYDRLDGTSAEAPVPDYLENLERPVEGLRLGVPRQHISPDNHPAVNVAVERAVEVFRASGADVVEVDLALTEHAVSTYYVIAPAEASSNLARFDGVRYGRRAACERGDLFDLYAQSRAEGFGPEVQRRIMLGTYVLSAGYYEAYYRRALQVRRLIAEEYERVLRDCHGLIGPTTPEPAFELGRFDDPLAMYLCDVYTTGASIAGLCAMSVPAGTAGVEGRRLPVGLQIQCRPHDESTMFRIARQWERATERSAHER